MQEFCPYDFEKIDFNNLAYELVFPKGWNWQRVKQETIVGMDRFPYISENDKRREDHFKKKTSTELVIIRENSRKGGTSGFSLFKKYLESQLEARMKNTFDGNEDSPFELEMDELEKETLEWEFEQFDNKRALYHQIQNGKDVFVDDFGNIIMYAIPCCPYCHNRLPIGWKTAEDFAAIALMAPSGGGKTTFLYSMMNDNWRAFSVLGNQMNGIGKVRITTAHFLNDKSDTVYAEMADGAARMCMEGGRCPQNTNREYWIPPVFIRVEYEGHQMILGIYDNAGENLQKMDLIANPNLKMLLDKIIAQMVLFDPHDMNISLRENEEKILLMPLEEQGLYQKNHYQRVTGNQLLKRNKESGTLFQVYDSYLNVLMQNECIHRLKEMQFHGILIKSDLLEGVNSIRKNAAYDILFRRDCNQDLMDMQAIETRSQLVQEMIREQGLFGAKSLNDFRIDFGELDESGNMTGHQAVTWHCISALGTSPAETMDCEYVIENYDPIRVAEPLAACILKRIIKNGWIRR